MDLAFAAERAAWAVVRRRLPGQPGHDERAWDAWVKAAEVANRMADGAQGQPNGASPADEYSASALDAHAALAAPPESLVLSDGALRELLLLAKARDVDAFNQVFSATAPALLRQLRAFFGDVMAEHALGEVYLSAWSSLDHYDATSPPPLVWLGQVAAASAFARVPDSASTSMSPPVESGTRSVSDRALQMMTLAHDIRASLLSANQALAALKEDQFSTSGATGRALKRSLDQIEGSIAQALQEPDARAVTKPNKAYSPQAPSEQST